MSAATASPDPSALLIAALRSALAAQQRGDLALAWRRLDEADAAVAGHPDTLHLRGIVTLRRGDAASACRWFQRATQADATNAVYWNNLGVARRDAGDIDGAEAAHGRAIALRPDYASAHNNLGTVLADREDFRAAAAAFAAARALEPGNIETLANEALARANAGDADTALAALEAARGRGADTPRLRIAYGAALVAAGRLDDAAVVLDDAVERSPADPEAWHNLGYVFERLGQSEAACVAFDRALAVDPRRRSTFSSRGLVRLSIGDFAGGWADYRLRRKGPGIPGAAAPAPLPADLTGRRFAIRRDQGVGDDLFFLRFAPILAARGADVAVDVDPRLSSMLARAGLRTDQDGEPLLSSDLPFRLGHASDADCPPPLRVPPRADLRADQRRILEQAGPRPWIAVSWRAGVRRQRKCIPAADLAAMLRDLPGTVFVVQRGLEPGELAAFAARLGRRAMDASAANDDLEAMLALMSEVDEHLAVSNTNVHLRAAAGRSSRVLVPFPAEWRWRADALGVPAWFRDHPVYRQAVDGDWSAALAAARDDLARASASG